MAGRPTTGGHASASGDRSLRPIEACAASSSPPGPMPVLSRLWRAHPDTAAADIYLRTSPGAPEADLNARRPVRPHRPRSPTSTSSSRPTLTHPHRPHAPARVAIRTIVPPARPDRRRCWSVGRRALHRRRLRVSLARSRRQHSTAGRARSLSCLARRLILASLTPSPASMTGLFSAPLDACRWLAPGRRASIPPTPAPRPTRNDDQRRAEPSRCDSRLPSAKRRLR